MAARTCVTLKQNSVKKTPAHAGREEERTRMEFVQVSITTPVVASAT